VKPDPQPPPTLVIGVGNRDRGDDAIGPLVIDAIQQQRPDGVETLTLEGDLSDLGLRWQPDQTVIVVDAMRSGRQPGTIVTMDGLDHELKPDDGLISTHGMGLAEAIELARLLDRLPRALTIFGVEAETFELMRPVCPAVAAAIDELAGRIPAFIDEHAKQQCR